MIQAFWSSSRSSARVLLHLSGQGVVDLTQLLCEACQVLLYSITLRLVLPDLSWICFVSGDIC